MDEDLLQLAHRDAALLLQRDPRLEGERGRAARLLLRLIEPSAGTLRFDGQDVTRSTGAGLRALRRRVGIVFQDPYA